MIKNYIKIAIRSFWRDKTFSIINLAGLAIGLAAVIMIFAYVRHELSYDKHYNNSPNVYRIIERTQTGPIDVLNAGISSGTARALQQEFPEIDTFTYVIKSNEQFKIKDEFINLDVIEASAGFFRVFDFPFVAGDRKTCLQNRRSMVITERTARTFFPGVNPVGQHFTTNYGDPVSITGIIKDIPANTHLKFEAVVSVEGSNFTKGSGDRKQGGLGIPQYILLKKGADPENLIRKLPDVYKKYHFMPQQTLQLQSVKNIHLHSNLPDELYPNSDIRYIYIFSSTAILILLIAIINYINLSTARSLKRTRETGVRKVIGASRMQLIRQFLSESVLFFAGALVLALLMAQAVWPFFSEKITGTAASIPLFNLRTFGIIIIISVIGGLLSGFYPALFLSRINPALSLKGILKYNVNISFHKALMTFQFVITGILITTTLIVQQQLHFISNVRLGFNKENLITIPYYFYKNDFSAFKNELKANSAVKSISVSNWEPGKKFEGANFIPYKETNERRDIRMISSDLDFIKTMGIEIKQGRDYSDDHVNDILNPDTLLFGNETPHKNDGKHEMKSILLNETAVRLLELKDPVGKSYHNINITGTVIGIMKDFNASELHQKIPALILLGNSYERSGNLFIRIDGKNMQQTLRFIENKWKQFYPDQRYDFSFVDDKLQRHYTAEHRLGSFFGIFASLAILIACFGLFGLISLNVQQRVKEIGIRKVLGASVINIMNLLSGDFLKPVLIAMIIASPAAWWIMNKWLEDFAYRVNIEWWVFALTGLITVLISFITVSMQSVKAARANPVKSLRTE